MLLNQALDSAELSPTVQEFESTVGRDDVGGCASVGVTAPAIAAFSSEITTLEGMLPSDATAVAWGRLTALVTSAGSSGIRDLFQRFDTDGSGTLDKNEFKAALATVGLPGASNKVVELIMKNASQKMGAKGSKKALDYATFASALQPAAAVQPAPAESYIVAGVGESKSGMDDEISTPVSSGRDSMGNDGVSFDVSASRTAAATDAHDEKPGLAVDPPSDLSKGASATSAASISSSSAPGFISPIQSDSLVHRSSANVETLLQDRIYSGEESSDEPTRQESSKDTSATNANSNSAIAQAQAAWEAAAKEPALQQFAALLARGVPSGQVALAMSRAGSYNPAVRMYRSVCTFESKIKALNRVQRLAMYLRLEAICYIHMLII